MKIVMVGSGNTATVLCALISKTQHQLVQIVSRKRSSALILANKYGIPAGNLDDAEYADAYLYIIALNDAALNGLERYTALKNKRIVHTAGSVSMEILKSCTSDYGVFYPLQTLSQLTSHVPRIPLLIDGNTEETRQLLFSFAHELSDDVSFASDEQRKGYHLAAVFVSNFSNHMYALAESFCKREELDFARLLPLLKEVNERAQRYSPSLTQTGPAMRNDVFTLNRHLESLSVYPDLRYIYLKLTESILKMHGRQ